MLKIHSSMFLPFQQLKLIVISRRRRADCGRRSPTPHCRTQGTTVVLTSVCKTGALLNATAPDLRDCCRTQGKGCNLIRLARHRRRVRLPRVRLISVGRLTHGGQVATRFSPLLLRGVQRTLRRGRRIVLFRGQQNFTPVVRYHAYK